MTAPDPSRVIVTQDVLESEVASLVDSAPETLDTLSELAEALGNDPNFATTVSTEIGLRAKSSDVNAALAGKSDMGHTHTVAEVDGLQAALDGKADQAALDAKVQLVTEFPSSPTPGVLYLKAD